MHTHFKNRGFTLIEAVVYIALLGLIMGGTIMAVWEVIQGEGRVDTRTTAQDEASFFLHKLDWALGSIDPTQPIIPSSGSSNTLSLTRYDGTKVNMKLSGGAIQMSEDGGATYLPITTSNVMVTTLQFQYLQANGIGPWGIAASATINGFVVSVTKYIRK